ncbi:MAG: serine protease [Hyphomonadaceae bacterium]|nr:serine protease [Hyphomonadaceae bacterium]
MTVFEEIEGVEERLRSFQERLDESLEEFGVTELLSIVSELDGLGSNASAPARALLKMLKDTRAHALLCFAANELKHRGIVPTLAAQMRVQALIELGQLSTAIIEISAAVDQIGVTRDDLLEFSGLEGRAFKQLFIETKQQGRADLELLESSRRAYLQGWELSEHTGYWHACNLLALNEIEAATFDRQIDLEMNQQLANAVIELAGARFAENSDDPWPLASLGEAYLALGQFDLALKAFGRFCEKTSNAFALNSARRQLMELWQIETRPERELKAIYDEITADLLQTPGSRVELSQSELIGMRQRLATDGYEGLFGGRPVPIGWVQRLIQLSQCIGRVERLGGGDLTSRFGTGTVFRGEELNPDWASIGHVFVTNEHVVSAYGGTTLKPSQAAVRFTQSPGSGQVKLGEVLWCSKREDHDITIFRMQDLPDGARSMSQTEPITSLVAPEDDTYEPVTVIGHPMGSDLLHLAIENLSVEDIDVPRAEGAPERIWYKCPTMEGNSGSPVLSWKTLQALAVHHREIVHRGCNEGISVHSIRSAIKLRPEGWNGAF